MNTKDYIIFVVALIVVTSVVLSCIVQRQKHSHLLNNFVQLSMDFESKYIEQGLVVKH